MTQLTIQLHDDIAQKAHRIAQDRATTVDALVERLIENCDARDEALSDSAGVDAQSQLLASFEQVSTPMGGKPWKSREELYDR